MAIVVKDRVKETTTSTGTGTITLAGASSGFQAFSAIGDGNQTFYTITQASSGDWEVGIGTYTLSGTTLSRDTILDSSNSGSAVNFGAGDKDVFVSYPAGRVATNGGGGVGAVMVNATTVTENYTIDTGTNAVSVGPISLASGKSITIASGQRWVIL